MKKPRFPLGRLMTTPGALDAIQESNQSPVDFLARHAQGDWGDIDDEDKKANEAAIKQQSRVFSAYHTTDGAKLYVITEWNRSLTTILLPEDY